MPGSQRYNDYTDQILEECVRWLQSSGLTQQNAAKEYMIPISTIKNKLAGKHTKSVG